MGKLLFLFFVVAMASSCQGRGTEQAVPTATQPIGGAVDDSTPSLQIPGEGTAELNEDSARAPREAAPALSQPIDEGSQADAANEAAPGHGSGSDGAEEGSSVVTVEPNSEVPLPPPGFVYIPPGTFALGSPPGEQGRQWYEDQRQITITRGFFIQSMEVTQGDWIELMGSNPSEHNRCGLDCPVENINWYEAIEYANAVSRAHGLEECYDRYGQALMRNCMGYRLPTDAEWEYAARAGEEGATYGSLARIAWYLSNSDDRTHRVGQKQPNEWGMYDVLGNVAEWTYDNLRMRTESETDPTWPVGSDRLARGGGLGDGPDVVRLATRVPVSMGTRSGILGLRLARTAP